MIIQPYSDEYLEYDERTGHYILTAKNLLDNYGINLTAGIKDNANGVKGVLRQVSTTIYNFIHKHNVDTYRQDWIIAHTESGRSIIERAMCQQFLYMQKVGYLSRSTDLSKRTIAVDNDAIAILEEPICEFGRSILYVGAY